MRMRQAFARLTTPSNIFDGGTPTLAVQLVSHQLYDPREGFPRDAAPAGMAGPQCYVNGIMNAVELDVGNLKKWLLGTSRRKRATGLVQQPERLPGVLLRPPRHAARSERSATSPRENMASRTSSTRPRLLELPTGYWKRLRLVRRGRGREHCADRWGAANVGNGLGNRCESTVGNPYRTVNCADTAAGKTS